MHFRFYFYQRIFDTMQRIIREFITKLFTARSNNSYSIKNT